MLLKTVMRHGIKQQALVEAARSLPSVKRIVRKKVLSPLVCSVLASFGIFGGISSLFVGVVCVVIHGLVSGDGVFDSVGTVLLIVAIPMILIGAIFLDKIERN
ncbi:MAG: hypothetical protein IPL32_13500 [Chloracidobacterium sp.]|nr:hypothetical protein [Chloracidobacterium sp.]